MTTINIERKNLSIMESNSNNQVTPVLTPEFRAYGNYLVYDDNSDYEPPFDVEQSAPIYLYLLGPAGVDSYVVEAPLLEYYGGSNSVDATYNIAVGHPDLGNFGMVDTDDTLYGSLHSDYIYAGPGDDYIGNSGSPYAYLNGKTYFGGSGNDIVNGSGQADSLYGDYADAPNVQGNEQWDIPPSPVSTVVDGNDTLVGGRGNDNLWGGGGDDILYGDEDFDQLYGDDGNDLLYGGDGPDTLYGGDGNDQLDGGPRGSGWTDVLYGGAGADIFYLSYQTADASSTPDQQLSWWQSWTEQAVEKTGQVLSTNIVKKLAVTASKDFFETMVGGAILGGVSGAVSSTVGNLLGDLFKHSAPQTPPITTEDVMVVADFDPREDVLFLPMETGKTLTADIQFYASAAVSGLSGYGATFKYLDTTYAEIFLDADFVAEFGITSLNPSAIGLFTNIFATAIAVNEQGDFVDAHNSDISGYVYPFQNYTADDYVDGVIPEYANSAPLELAAPTGSMSMVFGAFAPLMVYGPNISSGTAMVSGTNMGDILSVNTARFAPEDYLSAQLYEGASLVKGFGGDDIILGGNGQDVLYGGDGNDYLYSYFTDLTTGGPLQESLFGEDGNDILYTGGSYANLDGGDGTDTVSYEVSPFAVSAILANGGGVDIGYSKNTYTFTSIENLTGSAYADQLIGDDYANVIQGGAGDDALTGVGGDDTIVGGDGYDTVRFANNPGVGVKVDLAYNDGTSLTGLWLDAYGGSDTVDRATVEAYAGTPDADQFTGDGGNSTNPLFSADFYGLGGDDVLVGSGLAEILDGGDGIDNLQGLGGADTLTGGDGDDYFQDFAANWSGDIITDFETGDTVIILGFDASDVTFDTPDLIGATVLLNGVATFQLQGTDFDNKNLTAVQSGNDTYVWATASVSATPITNGGNSTGRANIIDGSNETDLLIGRAGDDRLNGNGGDDTLIGNAGNDSLRGEDGDDILSGGAGNDTITGNNGNDTLNGDSGRDRLYGGRGDDQLDGGSGDDELDGGEGQDELRGGNGRDTLDGGDGDDTVDGGRGNDTVSGGDGDDTVIGGHGNDLLAGGSGFDVLIGGLGVDTFLLQEGGGTDTVLDFELGVDQIGLADGLAMEDLTFEGSEIRLHGELLAFLDGVDTGTLETFDFVTV